MSVRTDETTSPERQREADDIAAAALGIDFGEGDGLRESQSISDRVTGAQAAMRKMALRWRGGGRSPYGYLPAPMSKEHGRVGWTLVPDPDAVRVIERIIAALLDGKSPHAIALMLNADGVLSPSEYWKAYKARTKAPPTRRRTRRRRSP
ncbi:hypothetical protein [Streptomyces sp. CB02959]|uniref:hypothetical protein n=1 Tax=Streptomyces sp. CB02959 TaxID=2020330 RepID=UPI0027E49653|nr:hypothetical protein [Streptomyces sp. CB02959]